jgi:hypothetical protein
VLGHELVRSLALADVVPDRRGSLDALAKDAGHEEREVADVLGHGDFVLGLEVRPVPRGARFHQHLDDGLEPRDRRPARIQLVGPRKACQQISEIRRGRVVPDGQVVEARSDRPIEEGAKLHTRDHSKFRFVFGGRAASPLRHRWSRLTLPSIGLPIDAPRASGLVAHHAGPLGDL